MSSMSTSPMAMEYPKASELEDCLTRLAVEANDLTPHPVFVTRVAVHGGSPPLYSVVLRSRNNEIIRERLSELLNRQLCLGVTAFSLKASEALLVIQQRYQEIAQASTGCPR